MLVDHSSHILWEGDGTWEDSARGSASGEGGTLEIQLLEAFCTALILNPPTGSLQRAAHASSRPLGGPALLRVCASRPGTGAGDCCRTGDVATPAVAAACDIAMGLREDAVTLMWLFHISA